MMVSRSSRRGTVSVVDWREVADQSFADSLLMAFLRARANPPQTNPAITKRVIHVATVMERLQWAVGARAVS